MSKEAAKLELIKKRRAESKEELGFLKKVNLANDSKAYYADWSRAQFFSFVASQLFVFLCFFENHAFLSSWSQGLLFCVQASALVFYFSFLWAQRGLEQRVKDLELVKGRSQFLNRAGQKRQSWSAGFMLQQWVDAPVSKLFIKSLERKQIYHFVGFLNFFLLASFLKIDLFLFAFVGLLFSQILIFSVLYKSPEEQYLQRKRQVEEQEHLLSLIHNREQFWDTRSLAEESMKLRGQFLGNYHHRSFWLAGKSKFIKSMLSFFVFYPIAFIMFDYFVPEIDLTNSLLIVSFFALMSMIQLRDHEDLNSEEAKRLFLERSLKEAYSGASEEGFEWLEARVKSHSKSPCFVSASEESFVNFKNLIRAFEKEREQYGPWLIVEDENYFQEAYLKPNVNLLWIVSEDWRASHPDFYSQVNEMALSVKNVFILQKALWNFPENQEHYVMLEQEELHFYSYSENPEAYEDHVNAYLMDNAKGWSLLQHWSQMRNAQKQKYLLFEREAVHALKHKPEILDFIHELEWGLSPEKKFFWGVLNIESAPIAEQVFQDFEFKHSVVLTELSIKKVIAELQGFSREDAQDSQFEIEIQESAEEKKIC